MSMRPKVLIIKSLILKKGHSLRSFANSNNLSVSYLSDVLNLKVRPSGKYAKRIANGLNVEIEQIFEIEEKEGVK